MTERFNNKGKIDIVYVICALVFIACVTILVIIFSDALTLNKVNVYDHGREAAHIEVDNNLTFDGYEWNDGDLILHYKEK